jgi:orotate phosphoribosyltransferase
VTQPEVLDLFRASGALLEGHFKLSSGLHSPAYLQCALVLQHPAHAEMLGRALGAAIGRSGGLQPAAESPEPHAQSQQAKPLTAVLSPALGGLIIGHEVARALGVRAIFAERQEGTLTLRRGFSLSPDDRVVVIEDVVTTGGSTRETMAVAAQAGATVVAAGAIIDRSGGTSSLGVPFSALATLTVETWPPDACPLCAAGRPITKPGSRG